MGKEDKKLDLTMPMGFVYASPEKMSGKTKSTTDNQTYPYIHAVQDDVCGHCGMRVDSSWNFCRSCGNRIRAIAPGSPILICTRCGRDGLPGSKYCINCGNEVRWVNPFYQSYTPIAPLYASPEKMSEGYSSPKKNLFKRLFGRNKE